jgi:hypothetical protein
MRRRNLEEYAMNDQPARERTALAWVIGVAGSFLIVAALVWVMQRYTQPAALNAERAAERAKALGELRAAETEALQHAGWMDQAKGIVRLPIEEAMQLVERDWGQNPAAARSNLIARVEKATAAPPQKPSQFE